MNSRANWQLDPAQTCSVESNLQRVIAGEERAAAWLYDAFATKIFRRLRGRYGALGLDPEDMTHDLFVMVFRDRCRLLEAFRERHEGAITAESLERRLWDLACGLATNRLRAHDTTRSAPMPEHLERADEAPGAERTAVSRERLQRLAACLQRGSSRVSLYFKMRFADGLAPEEIAGLMGWSKKATYKLKQRLNEAIARCSEESR